MEAHFQSELFLTSSDLPNLSLVIYLFHHGHHGHHGQPRWDLLLWFAAMRPGHWATWRCVATKFGRTSLAGATDAGTGRMHRFQLMDGVSVYLWEVILENIEMMEEFEPPNKKRETWDRRVKRFKDFLRKMALSELKLKKAGKQKNPSLTNYPGIVSWNDAS